MRKSTIFFESTYQCMKCLEKDEAYALVEAVLDYSFYQTEPTLNGALKGIFISIKPNIDSANKNYDSKVENGKKGGAPLGNTNAKKHGKSSTNKQITTAKQPKQPYDYDYDKDVESDGDIESDFYYEKDKEKNYELNKNKGGEPSENEVNNFCRLNNISLREKEFWEYGNLISWKRAWRNFINEFDLNKQQG